MLNTDKGKCCAIVRDVYSGNKYRCNKPEKNTVDGREYCGIHDPIKIKARQDKKHAKWAKQVAINVLHNKIRRAQRKIDEAEYWVKFFKRGGYFRYVMTSTPSTDEPAIKYAAEHHQSIITNLEVEIEKLEEK